MSGSSAAPDVAPEHPGRRPTPGLGPAALAAALLAYLVAAVFWPVLGFDFIDLDVGVQVVDNPTIRGLTRENLVQIFTARQLDSYYPVPTLTFALDYQIWGLDPGGFKLTNASIHLVNVLLVFWLALRLVTRSAPAAPRPWRDSWVAAAAAGAFAVHPLVVEPVAWVSGRQELLTTLGALGCLHFHLTARRLERASRPVRWRVACHVAAAVCCLFGCLSHVAAAVTPALVLVWDLTARERGLRAFVRSVRGTWALWVIAVATIVTKRLHTNPEAPDLPELFTAPWLMQILGAYAMNLKAVIWPRDLVLYYPRVEPASFLDPVVLAGALAVVLTLGALWGVRRRPVLLCGLLWFLAALAPGSQLIPYHIQRADRFLYFPLTGLAVAAALRRGADATRSRRATAVVLAAATLVVLLLDAKAARQLRTWNNSLSVWSHCLDLYPDNPRAHAVVANELAKRRLFPEAVRHFETAIQLAPDDAYALNNFALLLAACPDESFRDYPRAIRLAERACRQDRGLQGSLYRRTLGVAYSMRGIARKNQGRLAEALDDYHRAIQVDPDNEVALFNKALLLAATRNPDYRDPEQAVRLAEQAVDAAQPPTPQDFATLAIVYAEAGRLASAVDAVDRAIALARTEQDGPMIRHLRQQRQQYQQRIAGQKQRESP